MSREKIQKSITCASCGGINIVSVDKENYEKWQSGEMYIQDALRKNTAAERELLISATCDDCWKKMFPDCDDDDTDDGYSCMEQEYEDFN